MEDANNPLNRTFKMPIGIFFVFFGAIGEEAVAKKEGRDG
jgi:hypothetical protein